VFSSKKIKNCNEGSPQDLCVCGFYVVTVVVFPSNGFPRRDLALILGTGCGGQQWLWRWSGTRMLIKGGAGQPVQYKE